MPPQTRKRGGGGRAAIFGALGLGGFARLDLPAAPPGGLELAAAVDLVSGIITVSLGGAHVSASDADLAAALDLPMGPVGLAPGVDAVLFSSAEAIAALRWLICDRVPLRAGEDGGALVAEVAAALHLVEAGNAHKVNWGRFVWAAVAWEVVAGEPRRCVPHLLRLVECQRPELFAEYDGIGRLPAGKRNKSMNLQQRQMMEGQLVELTEEQLVDCSEIVAVDDEDVLLGNFCSDYTNFTVNRSSLHFNDCIQQVLVAIPSMKAAILDKEKALMDTRAAACRMRELLMEKNRIIAAAKEDIREELEARKPTMYRLEQDWNAMLCTFQEYTRLFHKSSAAFLKYRNSIWCGNDMAHEQNRTHQLLFKKLIDELQKQWLAKSVGCVEQITKLAAKLTEMNSEMKRLNVPDLNNDGSQL